MHDFHNKILDCLIARERKALLLAHFSEPPMVPPLNAGDIAGYCKNGRPVKDTLSRENVGNQWVGSSPHTLRWQHWFTFTAVFVTNGNCTIFFLHFIIIIILILFSSYSNAARIGEFTSSIRQFLKHGNPRYPAILVTAKTRLIGEPLLVRLCGKTKRNSVPRAAADDDVFSRIYPEIQNNLWIRLCNIYDRSIFSLSSSRGRVRVRRSYGVY